MRNTSILEPSCGTGVFLAAGSKDVSYTGIELDKRTADIAYRLHPRATIIPKSFETFNITESTFDSFDHVIGNIPFGKRALETAFMDMAHEQSLDRYFIGRSLDNLKPGGTMALIVHPGILANKSNKGWRIIINRKARFVGAVKLNDHSFSHSHTAIQPDILLFRKHPEGVEQRLQTFSVNDMYGSVYVQEDWINGAYFSTRQHHVMGIVQQGKGQWNSDVVSGSVTPETLEAILSAFEPEPFIPEYEHDKLRKAVRLHNETVKTSNLSLSDDEAEALERKTLPAGSVKIVDTSVYLLSDTYR